MIDVGGSFTEDGVGKSFGSRLGRVLVRLEPVWAPSWGPRGDRARAVKPGPAECAEPLETVYSRL